MDRSWIVARCGPALLVAAAVACASSGKKTNVSSPGDVSRDTAAASVARRDTAASVTRRDTAAASVSRRDTAASIPAMPTMPMAGSVQLAVAEAPGMGNYVTDGAGRAVYVIESTANAPVDCVETCTNDFEPVIGKATIATGVTGLDASLLGTKSLPDGRLQVTYEGKPLFFAKADMAKGDTKGQGTKSYGNARLLTPKK